jgi:hypothetical protein
LTAELLTGEEDAAVGRGGEDELALQRSRVVEGEPPHLAARGVEPDEGVQALRAPRHEGRFDEEHGAARRVERCGVSAAVDADAGQSLHVPARAERAGIAVGGSRPAARERQEARGEEKEAVDSEHGLRWIGRAT